jgi:hypothetical protein
MASSGGSAARDDRPSAGESQLSGGDGYIGGNTLYRKMDC